VKALAAKASDVAVGAQERLLRDVLGGLGRAEEAQREPVGLVVVTEHEAVEHVELMRRA